MSPLTQTQVNHWKTNTTVKTWQPIDRHEDMLSPAEKKVRIQAMKDISWGKGVAFDDIKKELLWDTK